MFCAAHKDPKHFLAITQCLYLIGTRQVSGTNWLRSVGILNALPVRILNEEGLICGKPPKYVMSDKGIFGLVRRCKICYRLDRCE